MKFTRLALSLLLLCPPIASVGAPTDKTKTPPKILLSKEQTLAPRLEAAYHALREQDISSAEKTFLDILAQSPQHPSALLGLAEINEYRGERPQARQQRELALKSTRSPPESIAAASLYDWPMPEAEHRLLSALLLYPHHHALSFSLGTLRLQQQRHEEALPYLRFAVSQYPKNPDYLYQLAVNEDLLRLPEAQKHYETALLEGEKALHAFDRQAVETRLLQLRGH